MTENLEKFVEYCSSHMYERTTPVCNSHRLLTEYYCLHPEQLYHFQGKLNSFEEVYFVKNNVGEFERSIVVPDIIIIDKKRPYMAEFKTGDNRKSGLKKKMLKQAEIIIDRNSLNSMGVIIFSLMPQEKARLEYVILGRRQRAETAGLDSWERSVVGLPQKLREQLRPLS